MALPGQSTHHLDAWSQDAKLLPASPQVQSHGWVGRVIRSAQQAPFADVSKQFVMKTEPSP